MMRYSLSLLILFFGFSLSAQSSWSLQRCIQYAWENNITIAQNELSVSSSELNLKQAKHLQYPNLSASSGAFLNFGRTIDPTSNSFVTEEFLSNNFSLNTGVTLYNAGRLRNGIKQSKLDLAATENDLKQSKNDIGLMVASTYLNAILAKENISTSQAQLDLSKNQLEQVNRLIDAGSRPANERLDIEAQIANAEQVLITAVNSYTIAILNLKQILRLPLEEEIELVNPADAILLSTDPDQVDFLALYNSALATQYNIAAGDQRLESATLGKKIAKSSLYPNITFGGQLGTNYSNQGVRIAGFQDATIDQTITFMGQSASIQIPQQIPIIEDSPYLDQLDNNLSYGFGLNISIPIYNNYVNRASIQRAELNIVNQQLLNDQLKENLKISVQQALADARAAKRTYLAAQKSKDAQDAAYINAQKRYDLGSINSYQFSDIKQRKDNTDINLLIAKYDYLFKIKVVEFYQGKKLSITD